MYNTLGNGADQNGSGAYRPEPAVPPKPLKADVVQRIRDAVKEAKSSPPPSPPSSPPPPKKP